MNWSFVIANAITLACIYGTLAIGLSITWSSLGLINMAYGFIFALSGYGAWLAAQHLSANGLVVMAAGILTGALGGLLVCALAFIPIHDKPNFTVRGMIATLALSLVGNQALLWYFGPRAKSLPQLFGASQASIFGVVMTADKIGAVVSSVLLLSAVLFWMRSSAGPLKRPWVATANTLRAPASLSAAAPATSVPAVSTMSSLMIATRPSTSPITLVTLAWL